MPKVLVLAPGTPLEARDLLVGMPEKRASAALWEEGRRIIGGSIRPVYLDTANPNDGKPHLTIWCNDDGELLGLPPGWRVAGISFVGTVLIVRESITRGGEATYVDITPEDVALIERIARDLGREKP